MQPMWLLLLTYTLLLSSHHTSFTSTHAQTPPSTFTPTILYNSQSVFIERQKLFILGGIQRESNPPDQSNQTFYIDLSKPWTTSNPIYGMLPDGRYAMGATTTLSNNNSFWYSFYGGGLSRFNLQLGSWEYLGTMRGIFARDDLPAFVDPATNLLYILNGVRNIMGPTISEILGTIRLDTIVPFSPTSPIGLQTAQLVDMAFFTVSWSTLKKTALIFGGIRSNTSGVFAVPNPAPNAAQNIMYFYNPSVKDVILAASDTGDRPTARYDHCMVEAYNGAKMILFGGFVNGQYLDDIYILDVASLKWTKGTPGGPTVARRLASCAVTNDLFVVWGGAITDPQTMAMTAVSQNVTIVYNLKTNQWQDTYSPDPYVPPLIPAVTTPPQSGAGTGGGPNPTGTSTGAESGVMSGNNSSIGWIIGGAVGGLAVVGIVVALLFIFRRRRQQAIKNSIYPNVVKDTPHVDPGAFPTSDIAGRQATKDDFYPTVVKGSPHTDPSAFPNANVTGRQATEDNFYRNVVRGSPHTDPGTSPTMYGRGRQVTRDDLYHNIVNVSPHTDPNAHPTSSVAENADFPRYHDSGSNPASLYQSTTRNPRSSFDPRVVLNTLRPERHPQASL
ncbi:MAG: hypothetical protein J3R72DRAFT_476127 [Linnemannia gamsii]|nr:MAG: hypothetical protein J3R72DRAFT_476127 [Linnemannia gamsii]